jgi:hypothetical protein
VEDPHHHGHPSSVGFARLRIFDEADEAIEWTTDKLLERTKQMNFLIKDPALGRCALPGIHLLVTPPHARDARTQAPIWVRVEIMGSLITRTG